MTFLVPFLISLFLAVIFIPLTILLSKKLGLVDDPKTHKHPAILHKHVIPRAGGVPVFLAIFLTSLFFLPFSQKIVGFFLGGLFLVIVGVLDDKYDLLHIHKLLFQLGAAIIVVASGVGIAFITNPFSIFGAEQIIRLDTLRISYEFFGSRSIWVLADIFAIFWIIWFVNMVNFSSGVDGQMPGIVFVALLVIFAASLRFYPNDPNQLVIAKLALIGAGATFGFLIFNFYPARIFPGDSGSYFLGFLVAVCAIMAGAKVGTAILVTAIPLIDGGFTVIRRLAEGKSPFMGDRKHLHHRLMELGWGQRRIALFYWFLCAILGAAALQLNSSGKLYAAVVTVILVLGGLLWLNLNLSQKAQK